MRDQAAGATVGILIPQLLHRFRIDSAVSSGAFVITVIDVVGYGPCLGIATEWLGWGEPMRNLVALGDTN